MVVNRERKFNMYEMCEQGKRWIALALALRYQWIIHKETVNFVYLCRAGRTLALCRKTGAGCFYPTDDPQCARLWSGRQQEQLHDMELAQQDYETNGIRYALPWAGEREDE